MLGLVKYFFAAGGLVAAGIALPSQLTCVIACGTGVSFTYCSFADHPISYGSYRFIERASRACSMSPRWSWRLAYGGRFNSGGAREYLGSVGNAAMICARRPIGARNVVLFLSRYSGREGRVRVLLRRSESPRI